MTLPVAIHLTPEKIMDRFERPHIVRTGSLTSLRLTRPPLSLAEIALKRAFDVVAAGTILLLAAPLLLLIALAIRLDSPGPSCSGSVATASTRRLSASSSSAP